MEDSLALLIACVVSVICMIIMIAIADYCLTEFDDALTILAILIIGIIIGVITYKLLYDPLADVKEQIKGEYKTRIISNNDVDIKITAELKDGEVTRTSIYTLKGKDFADSEINTTNKEFTKLIRKMLDNRQKTLDSLEHVSVKKECKIITSDNKQYKICPME